MNGLERAARSVLMAGFAGADVPRWVRDELDRGLGGICLYGNNVDPDHHLADLARTLRDMAPTAVVAVDEEGGDVTRLHTATGSPYAGPAVLGRLDDPAVTRAVAAGIGAELAAAGIWLDLAPSADVNSDPLNPVIGTRSFGSDPALVARHAVAFVEGLAGSGVAASVKHFPGHGDTRADSHVTLPAVSVGRQVLAERELVPFAAAVAAGVPTVMTSHVMVEAVDRDNPATFSRLLLGQVLRGDLGFEGVIVTDALDMAGAQSPPVAHDGGSDGPRSSAGSDGDSHRGIAGAAVRALVAGADLLCLGPGTGAHQELQVPRVVAAITKAVRDGLLSAERLGEAADRVSALRADWAEWAAPDTRPDGRDSVSSPGLGPAQHARAQSALAARATVTDVPEMLDVPVLQIETSSSPAVGATVWGLPHTVAGDRRVSPAELATLPVPNGPVLILVRGATADETVWRWLRDALTNHEAAWLGELGWPDPALDRFDRVIRTYGASAASTDALARALGRSS